MADEKNTTGTDSTIDPELLANLESMSKSKIEYIVRKLVDKLDADSLCNIIAEIGNKYPLISMVDIKHIGSGQCAVNIIPIRSVYKWNGSIVITSDFTRMYD
jgi:hypothetical protein